MGSIDARLMEISTRERRQARLFLRNRGLRPTKKETEAFAGTARLLGKDFQATFRFMAKISALKGNPNE